MARGQDPARGGGTGGELTTGPVAVLVDDRLEAEAALTLAAEAGRDIELVMAAGILGPAAIAALEEQLDRAIWAWCDDRPGLVMEALRVGLKRLVLEPVQPASAAGAAAARRLADIARKHGGMLRLGLPQPLHGLDPAHRRFAVLDASAALGRPHRLVP